jgi:hypothetical protein
MSVSINDTISIYETISQTAHRAHLFRAIADVAVPGGGEQALLLFVGEIEGCRATPHQLVG